jgi:hypothetical protein
MSNALRLARRAQDIFAQADAENRKLTPAEVDEAERLLDRAGQA